MLDSDSVAVMDDAASFGAGIDESEPLRAPMGVRFADRMYMSCEILLVFGSG